MRALLLAATFTAGVSAGFGADPAAEVARHAAHSIMAPEETLPVSAPVSAAACAPVSATVYFDHDHAELNAPAESTLDGISSRMRGCAIQAVSIEADPNAVATAEGRRIAGLRGAAVLKGLTARGLAPEAIVIAEAGDEAGEPAGANPAPEHMRISISPRATNAGSVAGAVAPAPQSALPRDEI